MKWELIRPILKSEIDRKKLNLNVIAVECGVRPSSLYSMFDRKDRPTKDVYVGTLGVLLKGIGRSFAWLEKKYAALPAKSR